MKRSTVVVILKIVPLAATLLLLAGCPRSCPITVAVPGVYVITFRDGDGDESTGTVTIGSTGTLFFRIAARFSVLNRCLLRPHRIFHRFAPRRGPA